VQYFENKKILLGISGSIAAYKSPYLIRELIKNGAEVEVVMTPSATNFVTPTILSNLSNHAVIVEMFDKSKQDRGAWHIKLAHWCDAMLIAPASATTMSRIANGLCDNALSVLALAIPRNIPLIVSPAMDSTMWEHPATQRNVDRLKQDGVYIIPPEEGELASGLSGPGRMPEIEIIMSFVQDIFRNIPANELIENQKDKRDIIPTKSKDIRKDNIDISDINDFYKGKKVLITAGPTYEKIDDVRYITNHSSGKMGYALAEVARSAGADVVLISGPVSLEASDNIKLIKVSSAEEMYNATIKEYGNTDVAILAAAVSDYTPIHPKKGKIKKAEVGEELNINMTSTKDILLDLGLLRKPGQLLIGFALESANAISNGWKKLKSKNCNMIVVNEANKPDSGFGGDKNTITILKRDGEQKSYKAMSKTKCAYEILKNIKDLR